MRTNVKPLARSVSIIGVGCTPFGNVQSDPEIKDMTERELFAWAAIEAMEDAGIEAKDVDSFYVGEVFDESHAHEISTSGMLGQWIGMLEKPGFKHETACTTSLSGLRHAVNAVASGMNEVSLSVGVDINLSIAQKGLPPHIRVPNEALGYNVNILGSDGAYWSPGGNVVTFLESAAEIYGKKYGLSIEQLNDVCNEIAIYTRDNAVMNPLALFSTISYQEEAKQNGFDNAYDYLASDEFNPIVAHFMRPKQTTIVNDGAAAVIVCATDIAKKLVDHPIEVIGLGMSTSPGYLQHECPMSFDVEAFNQAYAMAGIKDPYREIDWMSLHDCFSFNIVTVSEAAGYLKPGDAHSAVMEGRVKPTGDKPINTSGGRMNMGHAIGAAQGAEIYEAVKQMRGQCGSRQLSKAPETALIQGYGAGFHSQAVVLRSN